MNPAATCTHGAQGQLLQKTLNIACCSFNMPYHLSTNIPGDSAPSVYLKCGNLRSMFLTFSLLFWLMNIAFICQMATYSAIPDVAEFAKEIIKFFGHPGTFMIGPVIILLSILYFAYGRKTITWFNGVLINDNPISVVHYQIKRMAWGVNMIYMQSAGSLWILYPVTSEDNKKFKDAKIIKKETALNEIQVDLLKNKLIASGIQEKRFWFFTPNIIISFLICLAIILVAMYGDQFYK